MLPALERAGLVTMFQTDNLYLAAALIARGADYQGTVPLGAGRVGFVFADPDGDLARQEALYFRHRMRPVQPKVYADSLFKLRHDLSAARVTAQ